jgi:hypothetical protein
MSCCYEIRKVYHVITNFVFRVTLSHITRIYLVPSVRKVIIQGMDYMSSTDGVFLRYSRWAVAVGDRDFQIGGFGNRNNSSLDQSRVFYERHHNPLVLTNIMMMMMMMIVILAMGFLRADAGYRTTANEYLIRKTWKTNIISTQDSKEDGSILAVNLLALLFRLGSMVNGSTSHINIKKTLRGFGPLANYADRATAACWRSSGNFCG